MRMIVGKSSLHWVKGRTCSVNHHTIATFLCFSLASWNLIWTQLLHLWNGLSLTISKLPFFLPQQWNYYNVFHKRLFTFNLKNGDLELFPLRSRLQNVRYVFASFLLEASAALSPCQVSCLRASHVSWTLPSKHVSCVVAVYWFVSVLFCKLVDKRANLYFVFLMLNTVSRNQNVGF